MRREESVVHLRCGDDILAILDQAELPGRKARWADPLCEGPLRRWPDLASRRAERAEWLAARYGGTPEEHGQVLAAEDAALEAAAVAGEVVLWCDDDLYDQMNLVFWLQYLDARVASRASLINLGARPAVPGVVGLSQLSADQLAVLFAGRRAAQREEYFAAREAWLALTGGDPGPIAALAGADAGGLPDVPAALRRWLAELPSVRNGLSLTESLALQAVAAGADRPRHVFEVVQRFEERPWLGDVMCYARLRQLMRGPRPLLEVVGGRVPRDLGPEFEQVVLGVTADGRAVLSGREDWWRLAQPNRWHGSLLLEGPQPRWRWDEATGRVVERG